MKRRLVLVLISIVAFAAAIYYYVDTVFLPIQLKNYVIKKAEKYLDREVTIGTIDFKLIQGFIVEDITVASKDKTQDPFIHIQEITINLLLAPFFQESAFFIPNVSITKPFFTISRQKNGDWNFSDLLDLKNESSQKKLPAVLLRKFSLTDGKVTYNDKIQKDEPTEIISNINIDTTLSLNKGVRFVIEALAPKHNASLKIKGNHSIIGKKLSAQIILDDIPIAQYLSLTPLSFPSFQINDGVISSADLILSYQNREFQIQGSIASTNTDLNIKDSKKVKGAIDVSNLLLSRNANNWTGKGTLKMPAIFMSALSEQEFRGNITADLKSLMINEESIAVEGDIIATDAQIKIDETTLIKGNFTSSNTSFSQHAGTIQLNGSLDIQETLVTLDDHPFVKGSLQTTQSELIWSVSDDEENRKLSVVSDITMDPMQVTLKDERMISGVINASKSNLVYENKKLVVEAKGQIIEANVHLTKNQNLLGNPHFNIYYQYNSETKNTIDYKNTFHFTKGILTGVPHLSKIEQIEGIVTITPDHFETDKLTFTTQEMDVLLAGILTNFDKPNLNIEIASENALLQYVLPIFPIMSEKIKANVTGNADIKASYKGLLSSPKISDITLTAHITDATIAHDSLDEPVSDISGLFELQKDKKDLLKWSDLLFRVGETSYNLSGQLTNFSKPVINTHIISDLFEVTTQINLLNQAFQLSSLTGQYLNSQFDLKGDVHLFKDADPDIDLRGKITLDLVDAETLVPRLKHRIKQFRPEGIILANGKFKGKFNDWRNWQLTFDATSDLITLLDYPLSDISIRYDQRDSNISNFNINSVIYGGTLNVTSSIDLIDEDIPFSSSINLENLDLKLLREDKKPENELLDGNLVLSASLKGPVTKWRELTGEGSIHITDGYLLQWNVLEGISGFLLIPEFQTLAFTEAHGDFSIHDEKIFTKNAQMISKHTILDAKGWIDFDQNLNFDIKPNFSKITILQSDSIKKKATSVITQTEDYLNIKLTGTLKNPKHTVEKFPIKIIEETLEGATGTLKEVIGSIVEEVF